MDSKNASRPTSTTAGVLRPQELAKRVHLQRMACSWAVGVWVENYWVLHWDLPNGATYQTSTLPHPACTLSVERGQVRADVTLIDGPVVVTGVLTRRFDVTLQGVGWVFGIKFRPGGLASFTGSSVGDLRDEKAAAPTVFTKATVESLSTLGPHVSLEECARTVDTAMNPGGRLPERDYTAVLDIVSAMLTDRSLVRVAQVEERCSVSRRRLQRLFQRYIGATPKWVLTRYRIHDVLTELDAGYTGSLADLAATYGWFDQSHFTREFTKLVGVSPGVYQLKE